MCPMAQARPYAGLISRLLTSVVILLPNGVGFTSAWAMSAQSPSADCPRPEIIRVETTTSTWRARQRVSFPLNAAIRLRLLAAGLQVNMGASGDTSEAVLRVDYREERGKQVTLDIYGTEITTQLVLDHPQHGRLMALTIKEAPSYGDLSTLPYVDVIQQLETNPYFYFLGYIVRGALNGRDPAASLLFALDQHAAHRTTHVPGPETSAEASQTLPSFEPQYEQEAVAKAIQELATRKQPGAGNVFMKLLADQDWHVRVDAIHALERVQAVEAARALAHLATNDPAGEVRQAAQHTLRQFEGSPTPR